MYNLKRTIRTITKAPKLGVFTAIGAVIALTMLLAACPEEAPPAGPTAPAGPANLVVEINDSRAILTWDAVDGATEYRVYRADGSSGALVRINTDTPITGTTFTDTGLTNGTEYRYVVRAVNNAGESGDSEEVMATPMLTAPAAPANLSTTPGSRQVSLSWDAAAGATEYYVYRKDTVDGTPARIAESTTITETNYTDTGLTNDTTYRYTVRAVNAAGASPDSNEASATPVAAAAAPVAPENLSATAGNTEVLLAWNAVPGATEYRIFRADTANGTLTRIANGITITAATYTDTGLANGTAYRYTVRAANSIGESPDSNEITVTPVLPLPAAPANLSATFRNGGVILSWDAVAGAVEYYVYRKDTIDGALARIADSNTITVTSYTDTGVANDTTYRYTVRAVNAAGVGPDSNEASVAIPALPAAPENLSAAGGNAQISLSWDAVSGAAEYYVYRAPESAIILFVRIADSTTITDTAYTDTGLTAGDSYRYVVRAVDSAGESADSNVVRVTVPTVPTAPANLRASVADTVVSLAWNAVGNATEYRIYRAATANGTLTRIAGSTTITDTAYTDTGLTNGTAYRYTVRAFNGAGESPDSTEVTATPALQPPTAPANFSVVAGPLAALLSWDAVAGATEYRVYRATTGNPARIASGTTITDTTYTDTGLTSRTAYRYTVRAVNSAGEGTATSAISVTPDDHANALGVGATPVTSGTAITGTIDVAGDRDYFSVEVTLGESESATIFATTTGSTDSAGRLYDSDGTQLASNNDDGAGFNFQLESTITASGTYYVRVNGGDQFTTTGDYSLTVTVTVVTPDDHSNIATGATPITSAAAIDGSIDPTADQDYFSFTVTTSTQVTVVAFTTGTLDTVGAIFNSSGTQLGTDNNSGEGGNFRIAVSISASGTYYIRVASNGAITGDYSLTLLEPAADHSGTTTGATSVTSGAPIDGVITTTSDIDFFSVAVTASTATPVTIHAVTTGTTDIQGRILDSGGRQLARHNFAGNFTVSTRVTASGTYYIRAESSYSTFDDTGGYTLTVTLSPQTPANPGATAGDAQVSLSWDASDRATEYRIYRAATPDGTLTRIAEDTTITGTTYTDTGLTNGTAYRYTVRAANVAGESADSTEVTATPAAP